ncbi:undecaprenyldiphospho-muramoylpentapeptide beta-N-acetylglucosaminyltransferase [bacterium]|nr:undecaprenyldiphospho-muramoylpentapeptide beta-N-acetylglucosaminyltransferase [bacterium]
MKYIIAGGGTGGHLVPALNLADEIMRQDKNAEILFISDRERMGKKMIENKGYNVRAIDVYPLYREFRLRTLKSFLKLFLAAGQSISIIKRYKPDVALGTGGYVSGPVVLFSAIMGTPSVIQEQNSIPGLTTKLLSLWAKEIYMNYPGAKMPLCAKRKIKVTGNPINFEKSGTSKGTILKELGFDESKFVLLLTGGSQGASSLNIALFKLLEKGLLDKNIQIIWQTGKNDFSKYNKIIDELDYKMHIFPFSDKMDRLYSVTDLIVCRAGALTLSEVSAWGLPAVIIPYPHATGNHQYWNARYYVEKTGTLLLTNNELNDKLLFEAINTLYKDDQRRLKISDAMKRLSLPEAKTTIAKRIIRLAKTDYNG